jgi:hypothetical protein
MTFASTAPRFAAPLAALLLASLVAGCTTVEGTNALTDIGTFEREVMTSTAVGVGLVPRGEGATEANLRAPLAMPRDVAAPLPAPTQTAAAQLPQNSANPQIDTTGLSEEDMRRLRNARVVDLRSLSGRPMTEQEARALTARMTAAGMNISGAGQRPLYLPPERYYTVVGGRDMVCQAPDGSLVPLNDARCPPEIRRAIASAAPSMPSQLAGPGLMSQTRPGE